MSEYTTIRIWKDTLRKLRLIYAETGESMVSILDRLISAELSALRNREFTKKEKSS